MGRARTSSLLVLLTGAGRTGGCRWLVPVFVAVGVAAVQEHQTRAVAERDTADLAISHHGETALVSHSHFGRAFAHLGPDHQSISRGALMQGLQASLLSLKPNQCARFSVNCHSVERWELALIFNMKNSIDVELLL
jgi:hypothetical protein